MDNLFYRYETNEYRFIGADGSLGYRTGKTYRLSITWHRAPQGEWGSNGLTIERTGLQRLLHGNGYCPYTNQHTFFKNWERV